MIIAVPTIATAIVVALWRVSEKLSPLRARKSNNYRDSDSWKSDNFRKEAIRKEANNYRNIGKMNDLMAR